MSTVVMTHPKLDGEERAVTTPEAFEQVWSEKGWVLVIDEPAVVEPAVEAPKFPSPPKAPVTDPKIGA
jgi:hypothetical protein